MSKIALGIASIVLATALPCFAADITGQVEQAGVVHGDILINLPKAPRAPLQALRSVIPRPTRQPGSDNPLAGPLGQLDIHLEQLTREEDQERQV